MQVWRPFGRLFNLLSAGALLSAGVLIAGCAGPTSEEPTSDSLYALVQGIDGVFFYPPLGPEPTPAGTFDATLLDGISVTIEASDAAGQVTPLATFDQTTRPAVALLGAEERYWVNIPAATYVTDPSKTYTIRVLLDGSELGSSVLSAHVFDVLAWNPALPIGVHVRIEGSGAVRAVHRSRLNGRPGHCSDGVRNKDETGIDCGGGCAPCPTCSDGMRNQGELGVDCGGPCPVDVPTNAPPVTTTTSNNTCPNGQVFAPLYWTNGTRFVTGTNQLMHFSSPLDACFGSVINRSGPAPYTFVTGATYMNDRRYCCIYYWVDYAGASPRGPWCGGDNAFGSGTTCTTCPAGTTQLDNTPTCACPSGQGWDSALGRCRDFCSR